MKSGQNGYIHYAVKKVSPLITQKWQSVPCIVRKIAKGRPRNVLVETAKDGMVVVPYWNVRFK